MWQRERMTTDIRAIQHAWDAYLLAIRARFDAILQIPMPDALRERLKAEHLKLLIALEAFRIAQEDEFAQLVLRVTDVEARLTYVETHVPPPTPTPPLPPPRHYAAWEEEC